MEKAQQGIKNYLINFNLMETKEIERQKKLELANSLLKEEEFRKYEDELAELKISMKNRKYMQAYHCARKASSHLEKFCGLPNSKEYKKYFKQLCEIDSKWRSLEGKEDEPSFFPRELHLEEILSANINQRPQIIYFPILVSSEKRERLPFYIGHRIDKNKELSKANAFLVGQESFTGTTRDSGDDVGGYAVMEIESESYIYAVQLYKIELS